ncbi:hypothetical protein FQZ97_997520 [compost metagenome]
MNPVAQVDVGVVLHTVGFLPGWQLGFQSNPSLGIGHLLFGEQVIEEGQNDRCRIGAQQTPGCLLAMQSPVARLLFIKAHRVLRTLWRPPGP